MGDSDPLKMFIPKIKKMQMLSKILLDPSDLKKGLPHNPMPELTDKGMILSLTPLKAPLAKLSPDGMLKLNVKYNSEVIDLVDKYIEVEVIDDFGQFWVGLFFGVTVRGKNGEGETRGCKVTGIEGQTILAEAVSEGTMPLWKKFQAKVDQILKKGQ